MNTPRFGPGFFSTHLEQGYTAGKGLRKGHYLLTEPCAKLVYRYLRHCAENMRVKPAGFIFPSFDELFPSDPTDQSEFPGGGLYCAPLPVALGNCLI